MADENDVWCELQHPLFALDIVLSNAVTFRYVDVDFNCSDIVEGDAQALKDVGKALVLHRRTVMPYVAYAHKRKGSNEEKDVEQYAGLVGQTCAERILLYRS
ncbi:hypothetical protein E1301_Tti017267 [Triplophysa tibetana]|uniref:Uncharacterized protein n=1 Tax=Triplophysa tibetana TaxID=1572043 RepID=A0A5A9P990_9TELE|nr:hypothetical protein E1301_Tti017267 [Triplophysa tibetana]